MMGRRRVRSQARLAKVRAKFAGGGHDWVVGTDHPANYFNKVVWTCRRCGMAVVDRHRPPRAFRHNCAVSQILES